MFKISSRLKPAHLLPLKGIIYTALLLMNNIAIAEPQIFASGDRQNTLLELYTSEGCSSCPPADHWMTQLKQDPALWNDLFPVVFHVDYWNYLGWRDRFSNADYSQRQRIYAEKGYTRTVYTPGFFRNGREWRGWFSRTLLPSTSIKSVGKLKATLKSKTINVEFHPLMRYDTSIVLNLALLGFDIKTDVAGGENDGKVLVHDFVVLSLKQVTSKQRSGDYVWQLDNPVITANELNLPKAVRRDNIRAITFWLTTLQDPTPIQITGGWIH